MKYSFLSILSCVLLLTTHAQYVEPAPPKEEEEEERGGFKKENLFIGGSLNLGFTGQFTSLGIAPYIGYSLTNFLDFAISPSINYTSQRDYNNLDDRLRQTIYGPGTFVRIFPVKFIFAQAQYEFNLIRQKYIYPDNFNLPNDKYKADAHSFLIGGGYAGGRDSDNPSFFYISVMWDIGKAEYSPYKDNLNRSIPIFRAGYNIALFQGKR